MLVFDFFSNRSLLNLQTPTNVGISRLVSSTGLVVVIVNIHSTSQLLRNTQDELIGI